MKLPTIIFILSLLIIAYFLLSSELNNLGCTNLKCDAKNTYFLSDTQYKEGDTIVDVKRKLRNVFTAYERDVIWRRCILVAMIVVLVIYLVYKYKPEFNIWSFYILILLIWIVFYLYQIFVYSYLYTGISENGFELIKQIK